MLHNIQTSLTCLHEGPSTLRLPKMQFHQLITELRKVWEVPYTIVCISKSQIDIKPAVARLQLFNEISLICKRYFPFPLHVKAHAGKHL